MDGKKKVKVSGDGDHHLRVKRLLFELEKEFDEILLENEKRK